MGLRRLLRAVAVVAVRSEFRELIPSPIDAEGTRAATGIDDALGTIETLATLVDAFVVFLGLLAAVAALAFAHQYRRSRGRRLVIRVHSGGELTVPVDRSDPPARTALESAVGPDADETTTSGSKPSVR